MAKQKKKKKNATAKTQVALSDKNYILHGKARHLPISKCMVNKDWQEDGMADVYVFRKHNSGNVTVGIYLVDLFCAGLKDTFYRFNEFASDFEELLHKSPIDLVECDYTLAHNIIYGGIAYAEEFGIAPHPDFKITQHLLEEDTDDIPLLELEFGKDGKAVLMLRPDDPRGAYYKRQLHTHADPSEYEIIEAPDLSLPFDLDSPYEDEFAHPEDWTKQEWEDFIENTEPDGLHGYPEAMQLIYEELIANPTATMQQLSSDTERQEMKISFEALEDGPVQMGTEEEKELREVVQIINGANFTKSIYEKVVERLQQAQERWPSNPIFYIQLIGAHYRFDDIASAEQTIEALYARFPDYLFAKTHYADLLLMRDELDKIPAVFNNQYTLAGLYPDRQTFHFSELMQFNAIMCMYFVKKKDLTRAVIYGKILQEIGPDFYNDLTLEAIELLSEAILEKVRPIYEKARQDATHRQELLTQLGYIYS